jgi:hypothetical protein
MKKIYIIGKGAYCLRIIENKEICHKMPHQPLIR